MSYFTEARSILSALRKQRKLGASETNILEQLVDGLGRAREFSQIENSPIEWRERQRHRHSIFEMLLERYK